MFILIVFDKAVVPLHVKSREGTRVIADGESELCNCCGGCFKQLIEENDMKVGTAVDWNVLYTTEVCEMV